MLLLGTFFVAQFWMLPAARGQSDVPVVEGLDFGEKFDLSRLDDAWVDPISALSLDDEPLAPAPDFDFRELNTSNVFAAGVDVLSVSDEVDVAEERTRHLRALQALATAELAVATVEQNITTAEGSITAATNDIARAREMIRSIEQDIARTQADIDDLNALDRIEIDAQRELMANIDVRDRVIVEMALQAFTGEDRALETLIGDPESTVILEQRAVLNQVRETQRAEIAGFSGEIDESDARRALLSAERTPLEGVVAGWRTDIDHLDGEIEQLTNQRLRLQRAITDFEQQKDELTETVEEAESITELSAAQYQIAYHQRLAAFVAGTDIPLVALNAYVRASRTLGSEDPGCGIHWSQLAGIGRIESFHGYFGSSTLDANGQTSRNIVGLALDGRVLSGGGSSDALPDATGRTEENSGVVRLALIRDSDNGVLDGDRTYDRAVGPMQFIPSTWRLYGADGDGDGDADPQNIYDASLAAARYLCAAPGSMLTPTGEQRAYFAYNHDLTYSANVTRAGRNYHDQLDVSPESSAFASFALLPPPEPDPVAEDPELLADDSELLADESDPIAGLDEVEDDPTDGELPDAEVLASTEDPALDEHAAEDVSEAVSNE